MTRACRARTRESGAGLRTLNHNPSCRVRLGLVRIGALALTAMLVHAPGCAPRSPDRLVVATFWPPVVRRKLEVDFERWKGADGNPLGSRSVQLQWLALAPGDDPRKLAFRATAPHVILGGPASTFALLANMDLLAPIEQAGSSRWCTVARPAGGGSSAPATTDAWSDPRHDRDSLRQAIEQLSEAGWRKGYARLVEASAARQRISRSAESAGVSGSPGIEGAAIALAAPDPELAHGFLQFLVETQGAKAAEKDSKDRASVPEEVSSLVADLLGSTLVDAQDELWTAVRAIETVSDREKAVEWLCEPPPWPPASVAKYLGREGERAMALIETLAAEVAPEPPARAWLLRSWLAPARLVDDTLLSELSDAAGGRLCREPRFRAWLREEWTASARQRYRRVARWAGAQPSRPGGERTRTLP
jgi:hypothetical protein